MPVKLGWKGSQMLPDFIFIGAQKSASSFLQECLSAHPEAYLPNEETPFFEDYLYNASDLSWLEERFNHPKVSVAKRLGIKRPDYFAQMNCLDRIAHHIPDAKLLLVLRNPIDRFISAYFHYAKSGFIPVVGLNEGVVALLDGAWESKYPRSAELIEYGFYGKHLQAWLSKFPKEQMLVMLHDDVVKDSNEVVRTAYNFLGIDPCFNPSKALEGRPKPSVYNAFRLAYLQAIKVLRVNNSPGENGTRLKDPSRAPISVFLHKLLYQLDDCVFAKCLPNGKPVLSSGNRASLLLTYQEDLGLLSELLNRRLDDWRK